MESSPLISALPVPFNFIIRGRRLANHLHCHLAGSSSPSICSSVISISTTPFRVSPPDHQFVFFGLDAALNRCFDFNHSSSVSFLWTGFLIIL
jgi:hypothetical protein